MDKHEIDFLRTEEFINYDLELLKNKDKWQKYCRIVANAMSSIPWLGSLISTYSSAQGESEQGKVNILYEEWLNVHKKKVEFLMISLDEVTSRLDSIIEDVNERVESEEYLSLVRRAFKSWDNSETNEKREYIVNLISNAAATNMCPDDLIRLFNDWLDLYHEVHFKVIRAIYQNQSITRLGIWNTISDIRPRENSAEADLFKLLIRDLTTGGVIRQHRETTYDGQFMRKPSSKTTRGKTSKTLESAFENTKPYELTSLGSQFVHYTMNQVVKRIEDS